MLLDKVKETVLRFGLFSQEEKILVAFSGGVDSTALLHLLRDLQKEWTFTLALGHFNHKLRPKAGHEERFVEEVAERLDLPLYRGSEDVRAYASEHKLNVEEAARKLRYAFLKDTANQIGFSKIATGHTLSDQTETFFMRLFRGSGLHGLSGIFPVVDGMIVRPLLSITREEIDAYLESIKVEFQLDESNADRRFLRNRIRSELLPYLRKEFDPQLMSRIGKVTSLFQEDEGVLQKLTLKEFHKAVQRSEERIALDWNALSNLPVGLARRVAREFVAEIKGDLRSISFEDIESILNLAEGKSFPLTKNCLLRREQDRIFCHQGDPEDLSYEFIWTGKDALNIKEVGMRFTGVELPRLPSDWMFDNLKAACLDIKKICFPLTVRSRRDGDRYRPIGSPGRKKLKEIMRAKDIPLCERKRRPVFLSSGEIVWVYGLPIAEKFKIGPETQSVFCISREDGT